MRIIVTKGGEMGDKVRSAFLRMGRLHVGLAETHMDLAEAYMEISQGGEPDELANTIAAMMNSDEVLASCDLELARWVIGAIETRLDISPVDLSVKAITETVQRRHDTTVTARRVGYVIRDVIGLPTRRSGKFGGRYCVSYDADVIEAWMAKYEWDR